MLRAGAEAAEQTGGEELLKARGETAGHDGKAQDAIADTEDYSPPDVGNDKAVQSLKDTAQSVVDSSQRCDRHKPHPQLFHHERVDDAQHGRLKVVEEMSAADNTEDGSATRGTL